MLGASSRRFCHHPWSRLRGGRTPVGGVGLRLGLGRSSMRVRRGLLRPNALAPPIVECREVGETLGTIVENVQGSAVRGRRGRSGVVRRGLRKHQFRRGRG